MKESLRITVVCLFLASLAIGQTNPNLRLGNPSDATTDARNKDNYLLVKKQYVLSYNNSRGAPNWVSWTLKKSDIGSVKRQNNFHVETDLPDGFQHVASTAYGGKYDRGHMCDSKDRTKTITDNKATFSMANMQPQTADLNRYVWEKLEADSRRLAQSGNTLFIIAGCYGNAGTIGTKITITVPTSCWKLEVVEGKNPSVIVVDIPNKSGIAKDAWQKYATTMEDLERKTGLHLTSVVQN
jgi:endonuclease G